MVFSQTTNTTQIKSGKRVQSHDSAFVYSIWRQQVGRSQVFVFPSGLVRAQQQSSFLLTGLQKLGSTAG